MKSFEGRKAILIAKRTFRHFNFDTLLSLRVIFLIKSLSKIFHLYENVSANDEGLQKQGLCSDQPAFEQGGIFIVPYLL